MKCHKCGVDDRSPCGSCRECRRRWYQRSKPEQAARSVAWRTANAARYRWVSLRRRAMVAGIAFNLSVDDLVPPKFCPVLGTLLEYGRGKTSMNSPSVDRIDPNGGYVVGNVRVISYRANTIKSNATIREVEAVLRYMKREARAASTRATSVQCELVFESPGAAIMEAA